MVTTGRRKKTFYGHVRKRLDAHPPGFTDMPKKVGVFLWYSLYDPIWSETYIVNKKIIKSGGEGPAKNGRYKRGSFIKKIKVFS